MNNIQKIISGFVTSVAIFSSAEGMEEKVLTGLGPNNISLQLPVSFPSIDNIQKTKNSLQLITPRELDDGDNYSDLRLQELEAIYRSALEEIKWVMENYPLIGTLNSILPPSRKTRSSDSGRVIMNITLPEMEIHQSGTPDEKKQPRAKQPKSPKQQSYSENLSPTTTLTPIISASERTDNTPSEMGPTRAETPEKIQLENTIQPGHIIIHDTNSEDPISFIPLDTTNFADLTMSFVVIPKDTLTPYSPTEIPDSIPLSNNGKIEFLGKNLSAGNTAPPETHSGTTQPEDAERKPPQDDENKPSGNRGLLNLLTGGYLG